MNKKMLIKTLTALVMIAVVIPPFWLGGVWLTVLALLINALTAYEAAALCDKAGHDLQTVVNLAALMIITLSPDNLLAAAIVGWLIVLFVEELLNTRVNADFVTYTFVITMIVALAWRGVLHFYQYQGFRLVLFTAFGAFLTDTGAYFIGTLFGRHRMTPRISPHKTWEGSIGGYVIGALVCLILGLFTLKEMPLLFVIIAALTMPVISQIGDLSFSLIKRRFQIKDFASWFPGHGGILDRIDSFVFVIIFVNALLLLWGL